MKRLFSVKVFKILIVLFFNLTGKSLIAQTEVDEVLQFLKLNPAPEGTFGILEEALINPDKVLYLHLAGRGLKEFPVEILKFKNLIRLNLANNNITEIPSWIVKLTNLQKLEVRSNKLKNLPESVFYLPSLKELDLWGNQINAFPHLSINKTIVLEDINLSMNKFNDLPESILRLIHLRRLRLENNLFTRIPSVVFKMTKLEYLYLLHNRIYEFNIGSAIVSNLKGIDLAMNPISYKKVEELKKLLPNCIISTEL
jgi:Leucine-rich repeat (LRR) protein